VEVLPSVETGGSPIALHEIWREADGVPVQVTSYDGSSRVHTLSGLAAGAVYRIAVRSRNSEGYSAFSEFLEKAATSLPPTPASGSLRKVTGRSSKTSIYLEWDKVPDQDVQTSGYLLWMASNARGSEDFVLIMNGTSSPERNEFLVKGLQTAQRYRFKLQAINFNGLSPMSQEFTFNACLPPSSLRAPYRLDSSLSSITLGWGEPLDDGGCPVTGYAVFRDEGTRGTPTVEVNSGLDPTVRGIPTLR
jgi:titin